MLPFSGCFVPPVIAPAHDPAWSLDSDRNSYPEDASIVEVPGATESEPTLRGLFVPSDEGAPLVVHFAESGGAVSISPHNRRQYRQLAELGFASLAVDYRGVGFSDGKRSPACLDEDALRVWNHALGLVDGDEQRIVLRGCSIGVIAMSSLLKNGANPRGVVAFAPVRPQTVVARYGYAVFWDLPVWFAIRFVRSFSEGDPLKWIPRSEGFKLVSMGPGDELLGKKEYEDLKSAVEQAGGVVRVAGSSDTTVVQWNGGMTLAELAGHVSLAERSYSVRPPESDLLLTQFQDVPRLDLRRAQVFAEGQSEAASEVRGNPGKLASLDHILRSYRNAPADLSLAAASVFDESEMELCFDWFFSRSGEARESLKGRSFGELRELLNLEDPGGALPLPIVTHASQIIGEDFDREGNRRWDKQRLAALAQALLGREVPGQVLGEGVPNDQVTGGWGFRIQANGRLEFWEYADDPSGRLTTSTNTGVRNLLAAMEKDRNSHSEEEFFRRFLRCLEKAARL